MDYRPGVLESFHDPDSLFQPFWSRGHENWREICFMLDLTDGGPVVVAFWDMLGLKYISRVAERHDDGTIHMVTRHHGLAGMV